MLVNHARLILSLMLMPVAALVLPATQDKITSAFLTALESPILMPQVPASAVVEKYSGMENVFYPLSALPDRPSI